MKKRIALTEEAGKKIELMGGEMVEVGVDVHRRDYRVTLWSEMRRRVVGAWVQPSDPSILIGVLTPQKAQVERIVYEAGPTGYGLVRALRAAGFRADVIAPSRTPQATSQEAKSDRLDSRKLAMYSAKNLLQAVQVPTEEEEGDRQIVRMRGAISKKLRRIKQQIKSFLLQHAIAQPEGLEHWAIRSVAALRKIRLSRQLRFCLDCLLDDLVHFESQLKKLNLALRSLAKTKRHKEKVQALETTPGVGPITAMTLRTELIAPERFRDGREVSAMLGLAPLVRSTGQTRREGPLMKTGNTRLRTVLVEAAWRWVAKDPWAAQRFGQLVQNTGGKKKAIAAMARRLGIILWRINVSEEAYRPKPCEGPDAAEATAKKKRRQPSLPSTKKKKAPSTTRQSLVLA